jgi:colanic acid biosynthesis glycosyl transferase WcaI
MIQEHRLANVTMLPLRPDAEYREMLVDTDVSVITQQAGSGGFFFPSKLLTTLAWQKPVLTVADNGSELVHALEEGGFGVNVPPGNAAAVAEALQRLSGNREQLARCAVAGRHYVSRFAMERVLADFNAVLERVAAERLAKPLLKVAPAG